MLKEIPDSEKGRIGDNLLIAWNKINSPKYNKVLCSISGGADSDIVMDIICRCDHKNKVTFVWFDTGLEFQATRDHLDYLEKKYRRKIERVRAIKPIPLAVNQYGQPFLSKRVSEMIYRLQLHNFDFTTTDDFMTSVKKYCERADDKLEETLNHEYEDTGNTTINKWCLMEGHWYRGCLMALAWFYNEQGKGSRYNISQHKWLREFMQQNPPQFRVAAKCCQYAKKDVSHKLIKDGNYELNVVGVRKAEGGERATAYKSCFSEGDNGCDSYRPVFWYLNEDKNTYNKHYGIENSDCYVRYGMKRTGCCGCPYSRDLEHELKIMETFEPKLYKAAMYVFGDSYEYTRAYHEFRDRMNGKQKEKTEWIQMSIWDYI